MAQEILTTFNDDIKGVLLKTSEVAGRYTIYIDGTQIFDRKEAGGFIEIKELICDLVNPDKSLRHSDRKE
jgi:selenoprotein W-related protein